MMLLSNTNGQRILSLIPLWFHLQGRHCSIEVFAVRYKSGPGFEPSRSIESHPYNTSAREETKATIHKPELWIVGFYQILFTQKNVEAVNLA